jgi:ABC-type branched-subunit amino acid transport system substrate-binding protein
MEPPTASVFLNNMEQTAGGLKIPLVGSDITAGSDFISAVTPARATKVVYSLTGASLPSGAATIFTDAYKTVNGGEPLSDANYAYDATIVLALAIDQAKSTKGAAIADAIGKVASPPGTTVQSYADGLKAINAGTEINYDGASGPMDYNQYHNVFGPFQAVKSDPAGKATVFKLLTAKELEAAQAG